MNIGYVGRREKSGFVQKQIQALYEVGVSTIMIEDPAADDFFEQMFSKMNAGDQLVVYQLQCLNMTIQKLYRFLQLLSQKNIGFRSVQDGVVIEDYKQSPFYRTLELLNQTEKEIISQRTLDSLERVKKRGTQLCRPALTDQKIQEIHYLYWEQKKSLREVAKACGVSLGAVHKYVKKTNMMR